jgi:hypothetical protein
MDDQFYFHCTLALLAIEVVGIIILFFVIRRWK